MDRRPTQADVARAAGVHRTTVSLTFKNHPSIPEATKQKVMRCAEELGYSPDPMLSSLAAYRGRIRPRAFQGTLAWMVNDYAGEMSWRTVTSSVAYYEGALSRAKLHGFHLEVFDIQQTAVSPARLASILRARNIQGLLLAPQVRADVEILLPWEQFSAVTFGYSLVRPRLHTITATQFRATMLTMRQLKRLGYHRIGFYFNAHHDDRTDHNYLAGYLVETFEPANPAPCVIPPLFSSGVDAGQFMRWYREHRPDALMTGHMNILELLENWGIDVPGELGVASPLVPHKASPLAGVYEDSFHIGEAATDYLVGMIHRGERGIPEHPQRAHIEGVWHAGQTLRQRSASSTG
ncbi:MAG: LacI family DNA-binding transcriptional regulator [Candidatus Methylacidiphilales bacterium]|nr:LacI family DNA-binding transcriptional regulator [Candidatus Methylacidiphilales bacterium]